MKRYVNYLIITFGVIYGCTDDSFLEKYPLTAVSPETFFKTGNDFKLYTNQFYDDLGDWLNTSLGIYGMDEGTDNQINNTPSTVLNGQNVKPVTDANWSNNYSSIRKINIMLSNINNVAWNDINVYVAEGRFFRAWYYFRLLQRYGGAPWINRPLTPNDTEGLTTPRLPRNILADSIVADLDFAIANLPDKSRAEKFRIYKEAALAFKSRVCLYEGTWEKYHAKKGTPFRVEGSDGSAFLSQAMDAALEIINSGIFSIEKGGTEPYYNLFNKEDYSSNKEIMLWRQQLRALRSRQSRSQEVYEANMGFYLTKELLDSYLCMDGKPISLTSLEISEDSLPAVIVNRDPRLAQTIYTPGVAVKIDDVSGAITVQYTYPNLLKVRSGYQFRKGGSPKASNMAIQADQTAFIYIRYAEVLLNYIEAKAELNESGKTTLSQNDFDISINKLRERVNMPAFDFSNSIVDPLDPLTGKIPWYIVEIRRERRVELAVEGYRWNDIYRWAAAEELIKGRIFRGAKFQWFIDRGWYTASQIAYIDNQGYLSPWFNTTIDNQGGYNFNLSRDYLYPVPSQEELLGGYTNNPGWE